MKFFSKALCIFLSYLMCLQTQTLSVQFQQAEAQTCPPGKMFFNGRCVLSTEASNINQNYQACLSSSNPQECFYNQALRESDISKDNYKWMYRKRGDDAVERSGKVKNTVMISTVIPFMLVGTYMIKGYVCEATSYKILKYTSMAALATEVAMIFLHQKKNREMKQRMKDFREGKAVQREGQTLSGADLQKEAFNILADHEDLIAKIAKTRAWLYGTLMAGYAAAATAAIVEQVSPGGSTSYICKNTKKEIEAAKAKTEAERIEAVKKYPVQDPSNSIDNNRNQPLTTPNPDGATEVIIPTGGFLQLNHYDGYAKNNHELLLNINTEFKNNFTNEDLSYLSIIFKNVISSLMIKSSHAQLSGTSSDPSISSAVDTINQAPTGPDPKISKNPLEVIGNLLKDTPKEISKGLDSIVMLTSTPGGRIALSGVFSGWSGKLMSDSIKQHKESSERAEGLKNVAEIFEGATCSPADRNNSGNRRCYCFTESGEPDSRRENDSKCKINFASLPASTFWNTPPASTNTCLNLNGMLDTNCSCKNRKGPSGGNACMKMSGLKINGLGQNAMGLMSGAMGGINSLFGGGFQGGSMSAGNMLGLAGRIHKMNQELIKKNPALAKNKNKMDQQVQAALTASSKAGMSAANSGGNNPMLGSFGGGAELSSLDPKKAVEELEKSIGSSIPSAPSGSNQEDIFDMSMGAGQNEIADISQVMDKDFDYSTSHSDISTDSSASLFEVLSLRYQQIGMRRLFGVEKKD